MSLPILPPELDALPREDMKSLILALYQQVRVLVTQVQEVTAQLQVQTARVAELEAQLNLPPKNSDNSSLPPSKAFKANAKRSKEGKKRKGPRRGSLGRP